jgi:mannose-6-phosphate isomerase-like protein (cupin superfamily)
MGKAIVKKVWGTENVLVNEPEYCLKILYLYPGRKCSLHYHTIKKETFSVQSGLVRLEQRDLRGHPIDELLKPGETRTIMPKTPHRFSSTHGAVMLEVSTHHEDEDVTRIEPSGEV